LSYGQRGGGNAALKDYVPVNRRVEAFRNDHGHEASIVTVMVCPDPITFRAEVYVVGQERPVATGHASEEGGMGNNRTDSVEKVETASVGRALAFLGYHIKEGIASREEMEKVGMGTPAPAPSISTPAAPQVSQGEKERCARLFKSRIWKPTDDQFRDFVDYCEKENANWAQVLLEAEDAGCRSHAQIMRYAVDGEKPTREQPQTPDGYIPVRWPLPKMFSDPATDSQVKMWASKCRERTIPEEDVPAVRRLVLEAYGLEDDGSKAAYSLAIDWAINAEEEHLDQAVAAAEAAHQDEPLDLD
jgi:hypothetical protein